MVKKKNMERKNEIQGRWRITWMGQWDQDYVDEEVEGFFDFGPGGQGDFQFGYVQGSIDHRTTIREEKPAIEFSWKAATLRTAHHSQGEVGRSLKVKN